MQIHPDRMYSQPFNSIHNTRSGAMAGNGVIEVIARESGYEFHPDRPSDLQKYCRAGGAKRSTATELP